MSIDIDELERLAAVALAATKQQAFHWRFGDFITDHYESNVAAYMTYALWSIPALIAAYRERDELLAIVQEILPFAAHVSSDELIRRAKAVVKVAEAAAGGEK